MRLVAPRFLFVLALAFACVPAGAGGAEAPAYRVVETTDPAHELLPKTCGVCHKDAAFRFFVVAAPDEQGLRAALERLTGALPSEGPQRPANPHGAIACLFGHTEDPSQSPSGPLTFRTLEGEPVSVSGVERLCALCHPADHEHPPALGSTGHAAGGRGEHPPRPPGARGGPDVGAVQPVSSGPPGADRPVAVGIGAG